MQFIRNFIANIDIIKAVTNPTISIINSWLVNTKPNFNNFNKLAPNITGIAKKNVNSAAISLDVPINIPPNIVAPDLDVPGINASN